MSKIDEIICNLNLEAELVKIRRHFHMYPELSNHETATANKICELLTTWGIKHERSSVANGIVGIVEGAKPGKTVAIRGDIDALPITETNDVPYCSQNDGVMHACGHDVHITVLLGVAKIIKSMENELEGNVKFFFQPAEETTGGAERMIEAGCLENPHVDCVIGLHVEPKYEAGKVGIKYGKMYAASDQIKVTVYGKASHGAHPDEGIDAIIVAANILNTVQTFASRKMNPLNPAVCTFGTIHGGRIRNQIADFVEMEGILRTLDAKTRVFAKEQIKEICEGIAHAMGAKAEVSVEESYGSLINNDEITHVICNNAQRIVGEENVLIEQFPNLGTEDFAYFAEARKSCYFHLGCAKVVDETTVDLHNPKFDIDESCLIVGVKLQVENILSLLKIEA